MRRLRVALTGGIGSGKSTVANCFAHRGIAVIDADAISHALTAADGAAMPAIVSAFGPKASNLAGALDRAWMRERVFHDPGARKKLESILHPMIRTEMLARCDQAASVYSLLVIPLLFETSQQALVDRVLVVDLPERQQIERVRTRDNLDDATIRGVLDSQVDRQRRLEGADDLIDNSGAVQALDARIAELDALYRQLATAHERRISSVPSNLRPD
ncbi:MULTISPECIES: dephospho-CoA kinase [Thiorhodovibrio]|uniref:dephospho-CoA kinase n=1 Tax=Thiorhodovibrio TaxID=61593 RepID=UPI001914C1E8|nr:MULTISPECIES: dephospho-CoA kinase [Thiorhodovibrio]MBK5969756.1 dephospho-CoA kinase [Thiorhodovibrio winogradskyi]WPL13807.1 Dephospho-CoA kinase [Thiorhodovibrio litoralis]